MSKGVSNIEKFNGQDKSVIIPEGVEIIEDGAFSFSFTMETMYE